MNRNKIVPNLWFCTESGRVAKVRDYYKSIFGEEFQCGNIVPLGETPSGNTEMCEVSIFGQKYVLMSTEKEHHSFNDSVSFMLNCEDQDEIDKYWNYFTKGGKESQCGWCIDEYGLRWQILPYNLGELMSKPHSFEVMMKQTKIVIEDYLR